MTDGRKKNILFLSLLSLGVVYGDIGTSPLYAVNQIFFGHANIKINSLNILGGISLVFWALTLLIAIKYVIIVLKADNNGDGGVFAIYGIIENLKFKSKWIYTSLLLIAAGLLFGDGVITPAISVISSTEGIANISSSLIPFIVPTTLIILTGLFIIQRKGTTKVGSLFAPLIILWFASIAALGIFQIIKTPQIFLALNPYYAFSFLTTHSLLSVLFTLGAVMLAITGGEALYADISHFGIIPIRISWFSIVYPSLILNYLGQGAFLLGGNFVHNGNIFYSMVPIFFLYPMIIVATFATIIASQALISGAYSLASQSITLKLLPYFRILHTYTYQEGQIYIPFVNWSLYLGCVLLVIFFKSSNNLASAYGLAVSGVMLVTSVSMIQIASRFWGWNKYLSYFVFVPFILIDASFLTANSLKIIDGGYIPLLIGFGLFFLMTTWKWAKTQTYDALNSQDSITIRELIEIKRSMKRKIPRTAIIMSPNPMLYLGNKIPLLGKLIIERNEILPKTIIFLTIRQLDVPYCKMMRFEIIDFYKSSNGGIYSVILNFGFRENPNAKTALQTLAHQNKLPISSNSDDWFIHVIKTRTSGERLSSIFSKFRYQIFRVMLKNTITADIYFGFDNVKNVSAEIFHVSIH